MKIPEATPDTKPMRMAEKPKIRLDILTMAHRKHLTVINFAGEKCQHASTKQQTDSGRDTIVKVVQVASRKEKEDGAVLQADKY